eukprot:763946-Hanusia_phi.AAC.2
MDYWYPEEYDCYLAGMTAMIVLFPTLSLSFPDNLRAFKRDAVTSCYLHPCLARSLKLLPSSSPSSLALPSSHPPAASRGRP